LDSTTDAQTIVDPKDAAQTAGRRYVTDARAGVRRRKLERASLITRTDGSKLREPD
jgi:DNA topoisomerase-1